MRLMIERAMRIIPSGQVSLIKYLVVGAWSYLVVTVCTFFLHESFGASPEISFAVGIAVALALNIFLLKRFVFISDKSYWLTGSQFVITSLTIRLFEFCVYWALLYYTESYYLMASTAAMFLGATTKYFVLKRYVYK